MEIQETAIWDEVKEILDSESNPVFFRYLVEIHTEDDIIEPYAVTLFDVERDYAHKYGDEITITLKLQPHVLTRKLYPKKEDLQVYITKEPLSETDGGDDFEKDVETRIYDAVLLDDPGSEMEGARPQSTNPQEHDKEAPEEYRFQLINPAIERLRLKTAGGIYRDMRTDQVIQGICSFTASNLNLGEGEDITGVDVVEGSNEDERAHIAIPHGTPLMELPQYIQRFAGGVYTTDIAHYIQNDKWYIYPKFHTRRFGDVDDHLTIINLPEGKMPGIERTYVADSAGQVIILATDETVFTETSEMLQLNVGQGLRYVEANQFLPKLKDGENGFHQVEDNIATSERKSNIREYNIHDRDSEREIALFSPQRITANYYNETSRISEVVGMYARIRWENANPDVLYPGQPARYIWLDEDVFSERYGCLLGVDFVTFPQSGQGVGDTNFFTVADMTLFFESEKEEYED